MSNTTTYVQHCQSIDARILVCVPAETPVGRTRGASSRTVSIAVGDSGNLEVVFHEKIVAVYC